MKLCGEGCRSWRTEAAALRSALNSANSVLRVCRVWLNKWKVSVAGADPGIFYSGGPKFAQYAETNNFYPTSIYRYGAPHFIASVSSTV